MGRDREIREEQLRREAEAGRTAGRPVNGPPLAPRRGGTGGGGQRLSRQGGAAAAGSERAEAQRRVGPDAAGAAGRPVNGPPLDARRGGTEGGGQHLSRDDMRRAATEGLIERGGELKGDGLEGSRPSG